MDQDMPPRAPACCSAPCCARAGRWAHWLALSAVLVLALGVRVHGLGRPLWDDEIYTVYDASVPLGSVFKSTPTPLAYLVTKVTLLLGEREALLRLPYLCVGLLGVLALYLVAARLSGRAAG
ncbi:MAG TPA: hypothetical protein PKL54_07425, partial [Candidatus Hydrogenedentes bacterium]|nr:hypothetical protein [Candidatus Hydrogenedentota bacterium]